MTDKIGLSEHDSRIHWPNRRYGHGESMLSKALKAVSALQQSASLAKEADIVLAVCPPSAVVGLWAGWRSDVPLVGWVHYDVMGRQRESLGSTSSLFRDWIQNRLYYGFMPRIRHLAFVSEATANSMTRFRRLRARPPGWQALPNIYQRADSEPTSTSLPQLMRIKEKNEPVIVFLGRLARQKRWDHALLAAQELQALGVAAQWVFIGDGPEQPAFRTARDASPARERIHWLGSDPNALPSLAQADALVLTSLYEAWPTVILEAFDLGVPVISYDCPSGPAEMLGSQERGIVTPEDPKSLAMALAERFSPANVEGTAQRCAAGRKFLARHQPEQALAAWLSFFTSIIGERPLRAIREGQEQSPVIDQ